MFMPAFFTRMKEAEITRCDIVISLEMILLKEITRTARQRAVRFVVCAALRGWNDVLDFEWEIENGLRSPAILATMASPFGYESIKRIHFASSFITSVVRCAAA
jgi:hypothetical protein